MNPDTSETQGQTANSTRLCTPLLHGPSFFDSLLANSYFLLFPVNPHRLKKHF